MPAEIVVCVLALVQGEQGQVSPEKLKTQLLDADGQYDIATPGCVYNSARDEWSPFADHRHVLGYFEKTGFEVIPATSLLAHLEDAATLQELLKTTNLYIIDPVFLTLRSFRNFVRDVHGAIGANHRIHYCVIIPDRMPEDLRRSLQRLCEISVPLLITSDHRSTGWNIESRTRLEGFLKALQRDIEFDDLLDKNGTSNVDLPLPRLGARQ